ncbi:MAG: MOSC domain-containing protein [Thermoanaerobaculales bacterium]|nr:MOSC domain-containing protein [Thermoanaerobaculales bacterium]
MQGTILNVCVSTRKGTPKRSVDRVFLRRHHGLEGDAHAGAWHRQVSLLDASDISDMKAKGLNLKPGAFGENLVISGLDTRNLGIGSRLRVDEAEVEISQIGKVCHTRCAIYYQAGDCIMPRHGLFASVTRDGSVRTGSEVEVVHTLSRETTQAAVVFPTAREDAGDAAAKILHDRLGAHIAWRGQAPGSTEEGVVLLRQLCGRGLDLVVALVAETRACSAVEDAVKAVIDKPTRSADIGLPVCGIGAGVMLVAARTETAAEALESRVPFLSSSIVKLRRERAAEQDTTLATVTFESQVPKT